MEPVVYLDTNAAVFLFIGGTERLSAPAAEALRASDEVRVSPAVSLELQFLVEVGRLNPSPAEVLGYLTRRIGLVTCAAPFSAVVDRASRFDWTRDPFDRLIVGQAALADAILVTRDRRIREHYARAVW